MRVTLVPLLLLAAQLTAVREVRAQAPTPRAIAGDPVEFAAQLSSVAHLVELADGRVLVHDPIEKKLGVLDPRAESIREVVRTGGGPLEYRMVAALLRGTGDSILVWDPANARVLLLAPDASPVVAVRLEERAPGVPRSSIIVPRAVDQRGRWYVSARQVGAGDTTAALRVAGAARSDTLMRYATPQLRPRRTAEGVVRVAAPGLPRQSAWGVFADGGVLLIHGATYTPEVVRPDGTRASAAPIPFALVPVSAAERTTHLAETAAAMERMLGQELRGAGGRGVMPRVEADPPAAWPAHKPPILDEVIRVDSRDRAWVRVVDERGAVGERFDLLDRAGRRVDTVRLPAGSHLVAMGKGVLYATREDGDGIIHLIRYALP